MAKKADPIPRGFHTLTPYLTVRDGAKAIDFYKQAFGATEIGETFLDPAGRIGHAELKIGDSPVMLADENPDWGNKGPQTLGGSPVTLCLYVEDVDAVFKRALAAGAKELLPVADQFYGDRSGRLVDPAGHVWIVATHKEDVAPDEMRKRFEAVMKGGNHKKQGA
jgi:PhnB protein